MPQNPIPIPKSITESADSGDTVIARRWKAGGWIIPLLVFTVIWNGFLFFWLKQIISVRAHGTNWIGLLMAVGHTAVGVALIYGVLALLLNRTEYQVTNSELIIRSRPLPASKKRSVPIAEISQLFIHEDRSKDSYGKMTVTFELHMVSHDGSRECINAGLKDAHEALFIEHRLEEIMGIEAMEIAGEYRG